MEAHKHFFDKFNERLQHNSGNFFLGEKEQKRTTSRNQLNENVNYAANFGMDSFWGQLRTVLVSWAAFPDNPLLAQWPQI